MYKFNPYFTDSMRISFLQRVVLIHSYLYYELNTTKQSDKWFDEVSQQLTEMQENKTEHWIKHNTTYGYCFYDFDGKTGFDLWHRLKKADKKAIRSITAIILYGE